MNEELTFANKHDAVEYAKKAKFMPGANGAVQRPDMPGVTFELVYRPKLRRYAWERIGPEFP